MSGSNLHVVIGLGITGLSCVRFLTRQQLPVVVMDTREQPPNIEQFRQTYPDIPLYLANQWPQSILNQAKTLVVSPGVATSISPILQAKQAGVEVIGDVELFARFNRVPVIAITGANGKSTVTTLVGEMAKEAGKKVAVIGNIGTPVLDSLADFNAQPDLIVMELSSFQLETTSSLQSLAATVLNITPDHMDRYDSFAEYAKAKHRIHRQAQQVIINKEDPLSASDEIKTCAKRWYFTTGVPEKNEFGLRQKDNQTWLAFGEEYLVRANELKIVGKHNLANALSALALGKAAGLSFQQMIQTLKNFTGLPHRCQWVAKADGVEWINDSKGTNVGACTAALEGIGSQTQGKLVLLLGGDGKGADFSELVPLVEKYCRAIIVMGKDAHKIIDSLKHCVETYLVNTMQQAVEQAASCADSGDIVLLSPACSSLDQYQNFSHRGEVFTESVKRLLQHHGKN